MNFTIGRTKINFHTDYCSADNQKELNEERLRRISQKAQRALSANGNQVQEIDQHGKAS